MGRSHHVLARSFGGSVSFFMPFENATRERPQRQAFFDHRRSENAVSPSMERGEGRAQFYTWARGYSCARGKTQGEGTLPSFHR